MNIKDKKLSPSVMSILLKLPALFAAAVMWILSSQSTLPKPKGIFGFDKFQHLLAYAVLALCIGLWFSAARWKKYPLRCMLICAAAAALYGAVDEVHQYFVPGRSCDIWDWAADALGSAAGGGLAMLWNKIIKK
ncbi:VanZ family protein [Treponema sp. OttesenSCG-928-L16]|nr:VanZ family protein [Treponema sp. OttesenSCG-928-L16]